MRIALRKLFPAVCALLLSVFLCPAGRASNAVMGEIHFEGKSGVERTSGVWIDGEYVGYLKELSGSKKVMLLPGKHTIVIRQAGYKDLTDEVIIQPGEDRVVAVAMEKAITGAPSPVKSTVKISANPSRAAVFVDGRFIGHVGEFRGWGRAMLVEPGEHQITIALPGYETFEANISARPDQKVEIKTDLLKSNGPLSAPLLETGGNDTESSPAGLPNPNAMASPTAR